MYCSTCGVAVAESLSYCNYCGARIILSNSDKAVTSREVKPDFLVAAMVGTFVFGLFGVTAVLGVMKAVLGLPAGQILFFAALCFSIMIFLEVVCLRLLFRRNRGGERDSQEPLSGHTTKELGAPQVQALREPISSVTDQTTRAFDPIFTDRNKAT